MRGEILAVAGPLDEQAPVLDVGVRDCQPHGQQVRLVRLGLMTPASWCHVLAAMLEAVTASGRQWAGGLMRVCWTGLE